MCVLSCGVWTPGPEHCECLCACGPRDLSRSANPTLPTQFSSLWLSSVVPGDRNWCHLPQPTGEQGCSYLPSLRGTETWMEKLYC